MIFRGVGRRFDTGNNRQYEEIGRFWDSMAEKYGQENLCGLGWDWTQDSLMYAIGTLGEADNFCWDDIKIVEILLPETGWQHWCGKTAQLDKLYGQI